MKERLYSAGISKEEINTVKDGYILRIGGRGLKSGKT